MRRARALGWRVGMVVLVVAALASATGAAAAGRHGAAPDPSFGTDGRVTVPLANAWAKGRFGPIATAAGGKFLVGYVGEPEQGSGYHAIERLEADGTPDPSFGEDGSVVVPYEVTALAEDSGGGVVFGDDGTVERLAPDGAPDKAFDGQVGYFVGQFAAKTIAIDTAGRILVGGHFRPSARYYPEESQAGIMRFEPNGAPDLSFGTKGIAYVSAHYDSNEGEFGLLPDGSMLMTGPSTTHIGTDGSVLPGPKVKLGEGAHSLVVFPDGGFAVSSFATEGLEPAEEKPGCTVTRYQADGSLDPAFAQGGVFKDTELAGCRIVATAEGGLLVRGKIEATPGQPAPRLIQLDAGGARVAAFGNGGTVTVPGPSAAAGGEPLAIDGVALAPDGRIVVAGGARDAILVGLEADGATDPSFGKGGTVVESRSLPSSTSVRTVVAEPDGELIVAASTDSGATDRYPIWMRFTPSGALIPAADGAPLLTVPSVGFELLADGPKALYSIGHVELPTYGPAVTKYTRAGKVVAAFGTEGAAGLPPAFEPSSAVVDRDGGVTVLGSLSKGHGHAMAAYRLTAAGRPDRRFGHKGLALVDFPGADGGEGGGRAFSGLALSGGGVLLVGRSEGRLALAELGPSGRPRRGFGGAGKLVCTCDGPPPAATEVVADRGAFYVLSGWELRRREAASELVKVTKAGTIDRSFGEHGHQPTRAGGPVALLARGRQLIVVGTRGFGVEQAMVRAFGLDGMPRGPFGDGATVSAGPLRGQQMAAALQPNGRLILAGEQLGKEEADGSSLELLGLR